MGVSSRKIVKTLEVFANVDCCLVSVLADPLLDSFLLQAAKEGFSNSVVPAVSPSTHARLSVIGPAEAPPIAAGRTNKKPTEAGSCLVSWLLLAAELPVHDTHHAEGRAEQPDGRGDRDNLNNCAAIDGWRRLGK